MQLQSQCGTALPAFSRGAENFEEKAANSAATLTVSG